MPKDERMSLHPRSEEVEGWADAGQVLGYWRAGGGVWDKVGGVVVAWGAWMTFRVMGFAWHCCLVWKIEGSLLPTRGGSSDCGLALLEQ